MVGKRKSFKRVRFPADLVSEVYERWTQMVENEEPVLGLNEVVFENDERHTFNTVASWLDAYRRNPPACTLTNITLRGNSRVDYFFDPVHGSSIDVELPNVDDVNELMEMLERAAPNYRLPEEHADEQAAVAVPALRPTSSSVTVAVAMHGVICMTS